MVIWCGVLIFPPFYCAKLNKICSMDGVNMASMNLNVRHGLNIAAQKMKLNQFQPLAGVICQVVTIARCTKNAL